MFSIAGTPASTDQYQGQGPLADDLAGKSLDELVEVLGEPLD